jgi:restriction endonuclease S subunit
LYINDDTPDEFLEKMTEKYNAAVKNFWDYTIALEKEKLFYFILAYNQTVVLIKTGEKEAEKRFLGYEFSNRRGYEGIHAIQNGKTIDECTRLYDDSNTDNPQKASTYIYRAFNGDVTSEIDASLQDNVSRVRLVDMLMFGRKTFDKTISMTVKKNAIISKWELVKIGDVLDFEYGKGLPEKHRITGKYPVVGSNGIVGYHNEYSIEGPAIIVGRKGSVGKVTVIQENCNPIDTTFYVRIKGDLLFDFCAIMLKSIQDRLEALNSGSGPGGLNRNDVYNILIPLPSHDIQEKIISEITVVEKQENKTKEEIKKLKEVVKNTYLNIKPNFEDHVLSNEIEILGGGTPSTNKPEYWNGDIPWLSIVDFKGDLRFVETTEKNITKLGLKNSSTRILDVGDIIISARGTVGELAQLKKPMAFNQSCYGIKAKSNLNSGFLYYALKFEIEQFKSNAYGAIFDSVTTRTFDLIKIPLPPLSEQQKIVAEIEKLETEIQNLQKQQEQMKIQKELIVKKYLW